MDTLSTKAGSLAPGRSLRSEWLSLYQELRQNNPNLVVEELLKKYLQDDIDRKYLQDIVNGR